MADPVRHHPLKGRFDSAAAKWVRPDTDDGSPGELEIGFAANGLVAMRHVDAADGTVLGYTPDAWTAFVEGVRDGELELAALVDDAKRASRASE